MSERRVQMYVESVSSATVTLENSLNQPATGNGGIGIKGISVSTVESTAEAGFWGATGTCAVFEVIFRRL